ncbi:UFM1 specific ligase 1 [Cricetulus griseus]
MTDSQASKRFAATSRRPRPTESAELNGHASVLDLLRLGCLDPRRGPSLGGGLTCLLFPGASEAVMADAWEEIRRLAADFQRAQFAEAVQRLSERNCIEIVNKLISQKQLEVVHTLDGKEYITPAQISKEMRDELHVRGGRVNIVDLQQPLLPSSLSVEDAAMLLQQVMRPFSKQASAIVFNDTVVVSEKFINECTVLFSERMHQKAEKDQHSLLVKYQGLVVKQLVNQNKKSGPREDLSTDELDKEQHDVTNTTRKELQELSLSVKDLVLKSRKSSVTEE